MTLEQFISKYLGKKVDFDGYYGGQCVDLYRQYVKDVLGFPQSPGVGGAAEIWDSASPEYYEFIKNTPLGIPERGDIVIWNRRVGGGFGHVAIFLDGDVNSFTSLDQNWPTLNEVTKTKHNYSCVIGWLRPKEDSMPDTGMVELPSSKFEELVTKSTRWEEVLKLGYTSAAQIKVDVENYKKDIKNLKEDVANEKARADAARAEYNKLLVAASKALNTVQEPVQVLSALEKLEADLNRLDDLERQYADLQVESGKEKEELRAEIERLKALVKTGDITEYKLEELLGEIIRRLTQIVRK